MEIFCGPLISEHHAQCVRMKGPHPIEHSANGAPCCCAILQPTPSKAFASMSFDVQKIHFHQLLDLVIFSGEHKIQQCCCMFICGKEANSKGMRSQCDVLETLFFVFLLVYWLPRAQLLSRRKSTFGCNPLTAFSHEQNYYLIETYQEIVLY